MDDIIQNTEEKTNESDSIYIAIEKYFSLIILEFKEHLLKYDTLYHNVIIIFI